MFGLCTPLCDHRFWVCVDIHSGYLCLVRWVKTERYKQVLRPLSWWATNLPYTCSSRINPAPWHHHNTTTHHFVEESLSVVSGGAKGIDLTSQTAALAHGGLVVNIVASDLEKECMKESNRTAVLKERLVLISTELPDASWSIGRAMGRNKYIHSLADAVIVPECSKESGGTWAGVQENLSKCYSEIFLRPSSNHEINEKLLNSGASEIDKINIEKVKEIKRNIDYSKLKVQDISFLMNKSERAVRQHLTKNNISCLDYNVVKKGNIESPKKKIEISPVQRDLFKD